MLLPRSFARYAWTATSDSGFMVLLSDKWFMRADVFVFDNAAYIGDTTNQDALVNAGDVFTIDSPFNLYDVVFKNVTAGSNTRVVVIGPLMNKEQGKIIGIDVV